MLAWPSSYLLIFSRDLLQERYKDKLEARYEEPIHQVVTKVFRGLSGKKVIMPSKDFVRSVYFMIDLIFLLSDSLQPPRSQRSQVLHQGQRRSVVFLR